MTNNNTNKENKVAYKFEDTIGGQLLAKVRLEIMEVLEPQNCMLPERFQNKRDGGRSLAELETMMKVEEPKLSDHEIEKAEKAKRVEKYRQQWEENETLEYDVDDYKLHRFELAFVKAAIAAGWVEDYDVT
jgi:hypothetical protein